MKEKYNLYLAETEKYLDAKVRRMDGLEKELAELMATPTGYKKFMPEKYRLEREISECNINVEITDDIKYLIMKSYIEGYNDGRMDSSEMFAMNSRSDDSTLESSEAENGENI